MNISPRMHRALHEAIATRQPQAGDDAQLGFYTITYMAALWSSTGEKIPAYWIITGHAGCATVSRIRGTFTLYPSILGAIEWE